MIPPIAHQGKPLGIGLAHLTHTKVGGGMKRPPEAASYHPSLWRGFSFDLEALE
jgi:hypothetical protein